MNSVFTTVSKDHPRPMQLGSWQTRLLRSLQSLQPSSRISRKLLRAIYGKGLKHMCQAGSPYHLSPTPTPQVWDIHWKGKKLGTTSAFPQKTTIHTPLWLLATGPSVNALDLSKLQGMDVMGVNGAPAVCEKHGITPKFFVSTDPDFFEHRMNLVELAIVSGAHCFFSSNGISKICELAPELIAKGTISLLETVNRFYGIKQLSPQQLFQQAAADADMVLPDASQHKVGWSHNPTKGVFASNTVTYSACQLACWFGYRQVNILGMDLGASPDGVVRAYEQGAQARPSKLEESYNVSILPAFELMASLDLPTIFHNLSPHSRLPETVISKNSYEAALADLKD